MAAAGEKRPADGLLEGPRLAKVAKAKAPVAKGKAPVAKALVSKAPVAKAPFAKAPIAKAPVAKAVVAKTLVAKAPVVKASLGKAPVAKATVGKALVAKAPQVKPPAGTAPVGKAPLLKAPVGNAPMAKAPVVEHPSESSTAGAPKIDSWKEFEESDPLYALLGEVSNDKVFGPDGQVRLATVERYLQKCFIQKVITQPKDWVEVWAAMDIPVDNQVAVLEPILSFAIKHSPEGLGKVVSELLIGHRVKTKSIEESVAVAYKGLDDKYFNMADFLFAIFPRGPTSPWGWSRIGWSWQEWWKLVEGTLSPLDGLAAFDSLVELLARIEREGQTILVEQPQLWTEKRLSAARALLCKFAGFDKEEDLLACVDIDLDM